MIWNRFFNVSSRKVGPVRFVKIGRLTISWCVGREFGRSRREA